MSPSNQLRKERKGFDELRHQVLEQGICTECASCYITCPFEDVLEYEEGPHLKGECRSCGICVQVCPRLELDQHDLEKIVFGRSRTMDEFYGVKRGIFAARSTQEDIRAKGQDGGVATSILTSALLAKTIDGAAISGLYTTHPWRPIPFLAVTRDELVQSAGTRYTYSPNLLAFKEGVQKGLSQIAVVGTPCQIRALRKIQISPLKKYSQAVGFSIGLFCSESFSYHGLMIEKIQTELGIALQDIIKMNIKGGIILYLRDKSTVKIPLNEAKAFTEPKCHVCDDFSAELADISVGGIGLDGWTVIIIRSLKGERVFYQCIDEGLLETKVINEGESTFKLLNRLTRIKRRRKRIAT